MADEENREIVSEPAGGAPSNRDRRPNETIIEGELAAEGAKPVSATAEKPAEAAEATTEPAREPEAAPQETAAAPPPQEPPPQEPAAASPPPHVPKARPSGSGRALAAGAVGGAVVAALVAAAGIYLFPPKATLSEADANRLAALEAGAGQDSAAIAGLDKRVSGLEASRAAAMIAAVEKRVGALEVNVAASAAAGLDKRVGALEAANAAEESKIAAVTQAGQNLSGDLRTVRADVDAARGEIPALSARIAKLEGGVSTADLAAVGGRLAKLENALAAPKTETRAAPESASAAGNPAAAAIVAAAIRDKLASGAAYPTELAALSALGVDPAKLAPLKALVDGAPTDRALAASFEAQEPKALAAVAPKETGSVMDRFLTHVRGLVQVRALGETAGDDPQALASQIAARLERGDLDGALSAFARLPEPARQAVSTWGAEAQRKQAAIAAAEAIREAAVARLAQGANKP